MGDLVGQYDKLREAGSVTDYPTALTSYLDTTAATDKNPWNANAKAYGVVTEKTGDTKSTFEANCAAGDLGQTMFYIKTPGSTGIGFIGGAVLLKNTINNSTTFKKSVAIE